MDLHYIAGCSEVSKRVISKLKKKKLKMKTGSEVYQPDSEGMLMEVRWIKLF